VELPMPDHAEIPPEHTALKSLEQGFRVAGEERQRVRQSARRRSRRRSVLVTVASVIAVSGTAAIATKVFDNDDTPVRSGGAATGALARVPADRRPGLASVADPVDRYGWGVRVYYGRTGETCAIAGRLLRGRLGVMQNGSFHELAAGVPGQCTDLAATHALVAVRNYAAGAGTVRTVVYGVVDRTVTGIGTGRRPPGRPIPVADDGTFVHVVLGTHALDGQRAFVTRTDGTRSLPVGAP
jgi:hypothetical protein